MFDRIAPAIGDMGGEVGVIADQVVPISPLPDAFFTAIPFALGGGFRHVMAFGKGRFDQAPAGGEIGVTGRQGPDGVQVIGQNDDCVGADGVLAQGASVGLPEAGDVIRQQGLAPAREAQGEEMAGTRGCDAAVAGHAPTVRRGWLRKGLEVLAGLCGRGSVGSAHPTPTLTIPKVHKSAWVSPTLRPLLINSTVVHPRGFHPPYAHF